jgi:chitosanase
MDGVRSGSRPGTPLSRRVARHRRPPRPGVRWTVGGGLALLLAVAVAVVVVPRVGGDPEPPATASPAPVDTSDLSAPAKRDVAMQLVASAENSTLDWRALYGYIEWDVEGVTAENRGYTAGLVGFCSGCGDMTRVVERYASLAPGNRLEQYLPALRQQEELGMGQVTQAGLGAAFERDWRAAAGDPLFRTAQDDLVSQVYFDPAVRQGLADGIHALGQFAYFDALVMHGPGDDASSFGGIRAAALRNAVPPSQGGDETAWLDAFLDARVAAMRSEVAHRDTTRVDTAQRRFLADGNLHLTAPLRWSVYGDPYRIA